MHGWPNETNQRLLIRGYLFPGENGPHRTQAPAARVWQIRRISSRWMALKAKNSKPWRRPLRYRTRARNLMGKGAIGNISSMDTTSPGSSSPVKVAPMPSSPSSLDRPQKDRLSPERKTCTDTRTSSGWRGKRRDVRESGFGSVSGLLMHCFLHAGSDVAAPLPYHASSHATGIRPQAAACSRLAIR